MGTGRVFCVALPFILSTGCLVLLLVACFGNVTHKDLYIFRVDTTGLTINLDEFEVVSAQISRRAKPLMLRQEITDAADSLKNTNSTASTLGLDNIYDISLWRYCASGSDAERSCFSLGFDWASKQLNTNSTLVSVDGRQVGLPQDMIESLQFFQTAVKWAQIFYVIAFVALALSLVFGIFANCTRVMSCFTFLVAQVVSITVVISVSLSTAVAVMAVAAVEGTAEWFGVSASLNSAFLALGWMSVACALGAGFFWMFTICCCAPSRSRRTRSG
ncbi:hypothetical protein ACHAQH_008412 [Verticillium albo-atrum]